MYTAEELIWATQLAYCDFVADDLQEGKTIRDIVSGRGVGIYYDYDKNANPTGDKKTMRDETIKFIEAIKNGEVCQNWKIISVYDRQDQEGAYGIMIDTGNNEAIIAFRGSESVSTKQFVKDWLAADFEIINGTMTDQERAACRYLDEIANNKVFDKYQNIAVTGHSLGGDLALVSTIYTATDECTTDMASRIKQSVSMDGPGHPQEFIDTYQDAISKMQGVMTHYHWSLVGAIFTSLCQGDNYIHVDSYRFHLDHEVYSYITEVMGEKLNMSDTQKNFIRDFVNVSDVASYILQHSTASLSYTEGGGMQVSDDFDPLAAVVHSLTEAIDEYNELQKYMGALFTEITNDAISVMGGIDAGKGYLNNRDSYYDSLIKLMAAMGEAFANSAVLVVKGESASLVDISDAVVGLAKAVAECKEAFASIRKSAGEMAKAGITFYTTYFDSFLEAVRGTWNQMNSRYVFIHSVFDKLSAVAWENVLTMSEAGMGQWLSKLLRDLLGYEDDVYNTAGSVFMSDPLALDLEGDGFALLSAQDGVYFDEDARGLLEKTAWVSAGDALLALDLNGDGVINDGSELFGTSTVLADGTRARSGFEALSMYDENNDGVIDENDAVFSKLKVWQDRNSDGISQADELFSLYDMGITSLSLDAVNEDGMRTSEVTYSDGRTTKVGELTFEAQMYNTKEKEQVEISDEIAELPDVPAMGNVASLHTLMQLDETGTLAGYVRQFQESSSMEEKEQLVTSILYFITGADQVEAGSRGEKFDAGKLTVIEQLMGRDFTGTRGSDPVNTAASILEGMYRDLYNAYYSALNAQTSFGTYIRMAYWTEDESGRKYLNTDLFDSFVSLCIQKGEDMTETVADMARYLSGFNAENKQNVKDYFTAYRLRTEYAKAIADICFDNVYIGNPEADFYTGAVSADILFGGEGDDTLFGDDGDDILYGEAGNDSLNGGLGNDTYIFNRGDGQDTVYEYGLTDESLDTILFGEDIRPEDVTLKRDGADLILQYGETDQVKVLYAFWDNSGTNAIRRVQFADGTVWDIGTMKQILSAVTGTEEGDQLTGHGAAFGYDENETFYGGGGNDTIWAGNGNDVLYGEEGDDYLDGGDGDDMLIGGVGNDFLNGGLRNDTYIFHRGDGQDTVYEYGLTDESLDTILFGEDIRPEDVTLKRDGADLILQYGETDQVKVLYAFWDNSGTNAIRRVQFADGTVWDTGTMKQILSTVTGTEEGDQLTGHSASFGYDENETFHAGGGNDTIWAGSGNDVLYGEEGDDYLDGGDGNDILYGGDGSDQLEGGFGDDLLVGGAGSDTLSGGFGDDTYLFASGDGQDTIRELGDGQDTVVFGDGIGSADLIFRKEYNDLRISVAGSQDSILISDQFGYEGNRVEYFKTSDGSLMDYTKLELMIQAMASFEDTIGMMWEDAVQSKDERVDDFVNQWWTKEAI